MNERWPVVMLSPPETEAGLKLTYVCLVMWHGPAGVVALRNLAPIGTLEWDVSSDGEIVSIEVVNRWRRRGVATRMLRVAERISRDQDWPEPTHSNTRTPEGEAWVRSLGAAPAETIQSWVDFLNDRDAEP